MFQYSALGLQINLSRRGDLKKPWGLYKRSNLECKYIFFFIHVTKSQFQGGQVSALVLISFWHPPNVSRWKTYRSYVLLYNRLSQSSSKVVILWTMMHLMSCPQDVDFYGRLYFIRSLTGDRLLVFNHNHNKILKSDWLSAAMISALLGQFQIRQYAPLRVHLNVLLVLLLLLLLLLFISS